MQELQHTVEQCLYVKVCVVLQLAVPCHLDRPLLQSTDMARSCELGDLRLWPTQTVELCTKVIAEYSCVQTGRKFSVSLPVLPEWV